MSMIIEEKIYICRRCGSSNLKKNGKNRYGNQQYFCKDCKKSGVLNPKNSYTEAEKEQILAAYKERPSMRGISRLYGISRNTLASWLQKKSTHSQTWKRHSCLHNQMTYSSWMNCGHLSAFVRISVGFGSFFVAEHAKSLPLWLEIEAQRLARDSGSAYRQLIKTVTVLVISGKLMKRSSQKKHIAVLAKIADKPIMWNAGTAHYGKRSLALFAKRFLSRKSITCITLLLVGLSSNTICKLWIQHLLRTTTEKLFK